jgi:Fe2+ transport system protein FeoA
MLITMFQDSNIKVSRPKKFKDIIHIEVGKIYIVLSKDQAEELSTKIEQELFDMSLKHVV